MANLLPGKDPLHNHSRESDVRKWLQLRDLPSSSPFRFRVDDCHLSRAGMDYWQHLVWETVDDWAALLEKLPPGSTRWLFTKTATRDLRDPQYSRNDLLVFGCESQGLPNELLESHSGN